MARANQTTSFSKDPTFYITMHCYGICRLIRYIRVLLGRSQGRNPFSLEGKNPQAPTLLCSIHLVLQRISIPAQPSTLNALPYPYFQANLCRLQLNVAHVDLSSIVLRRVQVVHIDVF